MSAVTNTGCCAQLLVTSMTPNAVDGGREGNAGSIVGALSPMRTDVSHPNPFVKCQQPCLARGCGTEKGRPLVCGEPAQGCPRSASVFRMLAKPSWHGGSRCHEAIQGLEDTRASEHAAEATQEILIKVHTSSCGRVSLLSFPWYIPYSFQALEASWLAR